MANKMKSSKVKTIVVECKLKTSLDIKEFEVDPDIFDDVYLEAATRFAEQLIKTKNAKIAPILTAYEKKDSDNINRHFCYNSYYVIVNAGYYKKAEIMRRNFMTTSKIDLKNQGLKSMDNGKSNDN